MLYLSEKPDEQRLRNEGEITMNYDLLMLASKVRKVETLEQLEEVKKDAEAFMRREKNYAILTLMTVAEEFGEEEVLKNLDKLRIYISDSTGK